MSMDGDLDVFDVDEPTGPTEHGAVRVIVVRSGRLRFGGLLLPILIALAGVAVLVVRVQMDDWRGLNLGLKPSSAKSAPKAADVVADAIEESSEAEAPVEGTEPPTTQEALEVAVESLLADPESEPELEPEASAEVMAEPLPPRTYTAELYRPMLPEPETEDSEGVAVAEAGPLDSLPADESIERESERVRIERERLEALKDMSLVHEQREAAAKLAARLAERAETRAEFLNKLRDLLKEERPDTAEQIRRLVDAMPGDDVPPRLGTTIEHRAKELSRSIPLRRAWVATLRGRGVSERFILDELLRAYAVNAVARTGPRNVEEALIRSARDLLEAPEVVAATEVDPKAQRAVQLRRPTPAARSKTEFGVSHRR